MLEILIIISLAIALFMVLKNFPKTKERNVEAEEAAPAKKRFWQKFTPKNVEEIKEAIASGQKKIVSPGDIDIARKLYMESDPEIARILYEADEAIEKQDLREAENLSLEVLRRDTKCGRAYVVIGKIASLRGSFDDAVEAYKAAVKCNKGIGEAYFGLGEIQMREENFTEAIENLQKAVNIDRGNPRWYAVLGSAFMQVRQYAKAAKSLKRAASLDLDNEEYRDLANEAEDKMRSHATVWRGK